MFRLITKDMLLAGFVERFKRQYYDERTKTWSKPSDKEIYEALPTPVGGMPTAELIEKLWVKHGYSANAASGWYTTRCNECDEYKEWVVQIGEEPDYESHTVNLCRGCLNKLQAFLKEFASA